MKYFLVVKNEVIVNTVVAEPPYYFINGDSGFEYIEYEKNVGSAGIGWTRNQQGVFMPPVEEALE
jgi:hypothetical protein